MEEMQRTQDSLIYATEQQQTTGIQIFTDNQAALQGLKNPTNYFAPQIIQITTLQLNTLRT